MQILTSRPVRGGCFYVHKEDFTMAHKYMIPEKALNEIVPITIGDKIYKVNTRMSNFKAMSKALKEVKEDGKENEIAIKYALGEDALKEIMEKDFSFPVMLKITTLIMAAMQDISEEEAEKQFRK